MCTGPFAQGVLRLGREAEHSTPSSAEIKNGGAMPHFPHTSSWHVAYLSKDSTFHLLLLYVISSKQ
jgi:hypothetical protein